MILTELPTESVDIPCMHNLTQWDLLLALSIAVIADWLSTRRFMELMVKR